MAQTRILQVLATAEALEAMTPLAREGFGVRIAAGLSLRSTLADDLGLGPECVEKRIQTVFLDGSPVDDIDQDFARPGSTLALAGALPGVAGIAMQRGSRIGVFREGITHSAVRDLPASDRSLRITLKLFNTVAVECLAQILSRGVEVRSGRLAELLDDNPEALTQATFLLDGAPLDRTALVSALRGGREPLSMVAGAGAPQ
ncbi:MAG: hypothetical protein Q8O35_06625 [Humidesulfovibrio sp.]|uniref:hypothetical protein n=1 Tax=Humidesulfovibrio sp. TaxID=2910988 RepID=UPI002733491E|nr:hypothetical protein [Humidesulfovibrio sp.]MDP2847852.1 hypothetical protein [Humidesulfovibrio sp.]